MNTVSWFIYLTHVVPTLSGFAVFFAVASFLIFAVCLFIKGVTKEFDNDDEAVKIHKGVAPIKKLSMVAFLVCTLISILAPTEKTMYMIAASELGEEVLESPEAKTLYNDIRNVLNSYSKEQKVNE